ncbi:MAG: hypothetical protein IJ099_00005, partial [Alphaproteobacteria bacterium]|nr:hypothetical protein [Alphaproteobacteria bacterium]
KIILSSLVFACKIKNVIPRFCLQKRQGIYRLINPKIAKRFLRNRAMTFSFKRHPSKNNTVIPRFCLQNKECHPSFLLAKTSRDLPLN